MPNKQVIAAIILAILWMGESVAPMFEARRRRLAHGAANLALGVLNGALVSTFFAGATLLVTEWARTHGVGLLNLTAWPGAVEWPLAIVLFDCWQYLWHRLNHVVPVLWRFHSVHHSDAEMDATSAVRFHTAEILLSSTARLAILPVLGMTVQQALLYETLVLPVILFHHSNVRVPGALDRALRAVIVTPWMHWVHHSRWQPETDSNFSSLFSWWDRIFRTFRLREDPHTIELGLDGYEEREWRGFLGMLMSPFRAHPSARSGPERERNATPR